MTNHTIRIPWPKHEEHPGLSVVVPVLVNWFPSLTEDQVVANAVAESDGYAPPFPNPNLIRVELER